MIWKSDEDVYFRFLRALGEVKKRHTMRDNPIALAHNNTKSELLNPYCASDIVTPSQHDIM